MLHNNQPVHFTRARDSVRAASPVIMKPQEAHGTTDLSGPEAGRQFGPHLPVAAEKRCGAKTADRLHGLHGEQMSGKTDQISMEEPLKLDRTPLSLHR